MGDKARAREAAEDAGVPTIPGSDGAVDDVDGAAAAAEVTGFPIALKAAGGGGGRGIRIANDDEELRSQYAAASREAQGAFDDPRIYVERFVAPARHVEVQLLGDGERTVHLYERECSLQRRRQKILEETPAPGLAEEVRTGLCEAAVRLCDAIGYRSAGTAEFLVDAESGEFFFIEMNTRVQVEHPITEVVCGSTSSPSSCGSPRASRCRSPRTTSARRGARSSSASTPRIRPRTSGPAPARSRACGCRRVRGCASTPGWSRAARCRPSTTR